MFLLSMLYISSILDLAATWRVATQAFVQNGGTSDGVVEYLDAGPLATEVLIPNVVKLFGFLIGDGIMVCRSCARR
jgi:hypothetical protein